MTPAPSPAGGLAARTPSAPGLHSRPGRDRPTSAPPAAGTAATRNTTERSEDHALGAPTRWPALRRRRQGRGGRNGRNPEYDRAQRGPRPRPSPHRL